MPRPSASQAPSPHSVAAGARVAPHEGVAHSLPQLGLAALGIVFGDIGTSPLYTLHECLSEGHGVEQNHADVLGILSLIFWALTLVVSIKYLTFVMRADNHGEGGILALLALVPERFRTSASGAIGWASILVIIGAALLYGDGMITPAISVLSAMEGLELVTPALHPVILPATCAILVGLFALQRHGTERVGQLFGPVMLLWFLVIGGLGTYNVALHPRVLEALSPSHAVMFFVRHGGRGMLVLGSVVLAVTGGEALYADMGHFGARPIRAAWFALVMPALVLNYFGQGALILSSSEPPLHPFFALAPPGAWTIALVCLSTLATIIASQALISGAFSLTHQAVQLGFFPRVTIRHTSSKAEGQIYIPEVNWALAFFCIALVLFFQQSSRLAAAYGIAVTGTMAITSIIFFEVMRTTWGYPLPKALALLVLFLSFDIPFLLANVSKFPDGGYVPVVIGAVICFVMINWRIGRQAYRKHLLRISPPESEFIERLRSEQVVRTQGIGVFMSGTREGTPPVLVHVVERLHALPETVVLLTIVIIHEPYASSNAVTYSKLDSGFHRLVIEQGFMDIPDVPRALASAAQHLGFQFHPEAVTYYLGRETFVGSPGGYLGSFQEKMFALLSRNAKSATAHFLLPHQQVVEIGSQIDL